MPDYDNPRPDIMNMTDEQVAAEFATCDDDQLVAYWNLSQMSRRTIQAGDSKERTDRILKAVEPLLTKRGIPHEDGKRIKRTDTR